MRFSDLKVGLRLSIGFALLLAITMSLGAVALWQIHKIDSTVRVLGEEAMPSISMAGSVRAQWNRVRRIESLMLIDQASGINQRYASEIEAVLKSIKQGEDKLFALATSPRELEIVLTYKGYRDAFMNAHDAFMKSALERDGDPQNTLRIYQVQAEKPFIGLAETMGKMVADIQVFADMSRNQAFAVKNSATKWVLAGMLASAALCIAFALIVTRSIAHPAQKALGIANRIAQGDLSERVHSEARDEMGLLMQALEKMRLQLNSVVVDVRRNAESVAVASEEIASGSLQLSSRTEEQAAALEQTAASMEELSTTVQLNAESAREANTMSGTAAKVAEQGGQAVERVVSTMRGIREASTEITDIVSVIESIAFQTNILALNAAVEAARAGEQGRGFAVVAAEVRVLAGRCAQAAKEIKHVVDSNGQRILAGSEMAERAGETMHEVVQAIARVNALVATISASSAEQASGVEQIGHVINELDSNTQKNAALVEENAAASDSLKAQAQALVRAVAVFKVDDLATKHMLTA